MQTLIVFLLVALIFLSSPFLQRLLRRDHLVLIEAASRRALLSWSHHEVVAGFAAFFGFERGSMAIRENAHPRVVNREVLRSTEKH
jgi:hypothetical protein